MFFLGFFEKNSAAANLLIYQLFFVFLHFLFEFYDTDTTRSRATDYRGI